MLIRVTAAVTKRCFPERDAGGAGGGGRLERILLGDFKIWGFPGAPWEGPGEVWDVLGGVMGASWGVLEACLGLQESVLACFRLGEMGRG